MDAGTAAAVASAVVAVGAAIIAWWQARLARRQAASAERQAASAEQQAASAEQQAIHAKRQVEEAARQADAAERSATLTQEQLEVSRAQLADLRAERQQIDARERVARLRTLVTLAERFQDAADAAWKNSRVGYVRDGETVLRGYRRAEDDLAAHEAQLSGSIDDGIRDHIERHRQARRTFDEDFHRAVQESNEAAYSYLVDHVMRLDQALDGLRTAVTRELQR